MASHLAHFTPTVKECENFEPTEDAIRLNKAMKGLGTDEKMLTDAIVDKTNDQRQEIVKEYEKLYEKDLKHEIKKELSGNLLKLVLAMLTRHEEYLCSHLNYALSKPGSKNFYLIDVICTSTNEELKRINSTYLKVYKRSLQDDFHRLPAGDFRNFITKQSLGNRDESTATDLKKAAKDAKHLQKITPAEWNSKESKLHTILTEYNYKQLELVLNEYQDLTSVSVADEILTVMTGDIQEALIALLKSVKNRSAYLAERLLYSIKGIGTHDDLLIWIFVSRSEIDLGQIKREYEKLCNRALKNDISGDTSGDYKRVLLDILNGKPNN